MLRLMTAIAGAVALGTPQLVSAYDQLPRLLANQSPEDFARKTLIKDYPPEEAVVVSTQDAYTRGRPLKGAYAEDVHLRALVERESGRVTWQVWHDLVTTSGHKNITAVHFRSGGNLQTAEPFTVDKWLDQCPPTDGIGSCNHFTRVGFELPETSVREIAAAYHAGSRVPWRLQFKDVSGNDVTGGLAPAEAAGLLAALESWQRSRP
jgi:hypothetical protein